MYNDWTPAALRAIEDAQRLGDHEQFAWPARLVLALLQEEEGRVAQLLLAAGLSLGRVREIAQAHRSAVQPALSLTRIESTARQVAQGASGDRAVGSEHLFLAALQCDDDLKQRLESAGLLVSELETAAGLRASPVIPVDEPLELDEPREWIDTARILDANLNRAREALRVIEDYCRFVLNDATLSRELKELRHSLAAAAESIDRLALASARDTHGDVGTSISTAEEFRRDSLIDVVQANCKRLQESLRSLEEHSKVTRPAAASAFEQLRYRSYVVESALLLGTHARRKLQNARLYLIAAASQCAASLEFVISEACAGGVDVVQLREKELSDRELIDRARKVRRWTRDAGVLFIMNDRPDIARFVEADGVHLGQDDLPVHVARRILGPDAIIGVSTHTLAQVRQAVLDGASYIGVGPIFPSSTKEFEEFPGLDFVRAAAAETTLPAFALGGISLANVDQVVAAGASRIAVSSAICTVDEPQPVARELRNRLR